MMKKGHIVFVTSHTSEKIPVNIRGQSLQMRSGDLGELLRQETVKINLPTNRKKVNELKQGKTINLK